MSNIFENALLLGLGAVTMGKNTAESVLRDALKKNNIADTECDTILKSVVEEGKKTKDILEQAIENVLKTRGKCLLPCSDQLEKLETRVAELEKELATLKGKE